jgi:hypothetical protein
LFRRTERLTYVADQAARRELRSVEIKDSKLFIARTTPAVPDAARDLALRLNGVVPPARIIEVLSELTGGPGSPTGLRICAPATPLPTNRRCWRR